MNSFLPYRLLHCLAVAAGVGALAPQAEAGPGQASLPEGLSPISCRLRVLVGSEPVSFEIPEDFGQDPADAALEVARGITLSLERAGGGCVISALVLRPPEDGDVTVEVTAEVPVSRDSHPARFHPSTRADVVFLGAHGGGSSVARGVYDPANDSGWDFSLVDDSLDFRQSDRTVRIEGRVPRGRETVIFHVRPVKSVLLPASAGLRAGLPDRLASETSSFGGCILPGGAETVETAQTLLQTLPCLRGAYLEVADGWQGEKASGWFRVSSREWTSALSGDGRGGEDLGDTLAALEDLGFRPGVWIVAHGHAEEEVFQRSPEAFVRDRGGNPIADAYLGPHVVDGTSPEGLSFLEGLFRSLRSRGASIVRVGGLSRVLAFYGRERENLLRSDAEPLPVCRATFRAMRRGLGEGGILVGDWDTPASLAGVLDAAIPPVLARDGVDPLQRAAAAAARSYFRHRGAWWVESLPVSEWGSPEIAPGTVGDSSRILFATLTGRGLLVDATRPIPAHALLDLPLAWPPCDSRPLDLFPRESPPAVWDLKLGSEGTGGDIAGLFNWSASKTTGVRLDRESLGLPTAEKSPRLIFDLRAESLAGVLSGPREVLLLPQRSALFSLVRDSGHPRILGASGDLRETAALIAEARWDEGTGTLQGTVTMPRGGEERVLHVFCGPTWRLEDADVDDGTVEMSVREGHVPVRIRGDPEASCSFRLQFRRLDPAGVAWTPAPPRNLRVTPDATERCPVVEWDAGEDSIRWWKGVEGFVVLRDGAVIGRCDGRVFLDRGAIPGTSCSYSVGVLSGKSDTPDPESVSTPIAFEVPAAEDAYLDVWTVAGSEPAPDALARRRSVVGGPLSVGGQRFERGLGTRATTRVEFDLGGHYELFLAEVGVDDASRFQGSVRFVVEVDARERHRTDVLRGGGEKIESLRVSLRGAERLSLIVEDAGDGQEADLADWGDARVLVPASVPLRRAHAHNDYLHARPLLDALAHRFHSVEADVFLVEGKLLVAHDRSGLQPDRSLESLYLKPLQERVLAAGGEVYAAGGSFTLLVDIKADGEKVYPVLRRLLEKYSAILTRFEGDTVIPGAVTVILSGDRPRDLLLAQPVRYAGLDGRLPDLEDPDPAPVALLPLISDHWSRVSLWRGEGAMPPDDRRRLHDLVAKAHDQERRVRFWATPDRPEVWGELLEAGVDLINTDDLEGLEKFLSER